MDKKVIIFDLDGVLFDSVELMHQITHDQYIDMPMDKVLELHMGNMFAQEIVWPKKEQTEEQKEQYFKEYQKKKTDVLMYEGMKDLIVDLSQQVILAVNTSARLETSLPLLERENIAHYFSFLATKEVHTSKVEKFKMIAKEFNQRTEDMLFITDTIGDLREASDVNLPTIAVTWGIHNKEYFKKENCNNLLGIVESTKELEVLIDYFLK